MGKEIYGLHNHISTLHNKKLFLDEALEQKADVLSITDYLTLSSYYDLFSNLDKSDIDKYKKLKFIIGMELAGMFPFTMVDNRKIDVPINLLAYNLNMENYFNFYEFIWENYSFLKYPTINKLIEEIHENEALAFFSQTASYFPKSGDEEKTKKAWDNAYKLTNDVLKANPSIDGLEIRHPAYLDNQEFYDYLENTAKTKELFVSGGTDYHQSGEKITLDYNDKYIDNTVLTNVNDWAIMYTLDEMIDLSKEIGKIENHDKKRILGK